MSLLERVKKLIDILGHPYKEVVLESTYDGLFIDSIEIINDCVYVNIWDGDYEIQYLFDDMSLGMKKEIVKGLEDLI